MKLRFVVLLLVLLTATLCSTSSAGPIAQYCKLECAKPAGCPILVSPGSGDIGVGYHEPDRMFLFFIKPDRFQPKGAVTPPFEP